LSVWIRTVTANLKRPINPASYFPASPYQGQEHGQKKVVYVESEP
jgi:hypothetical protein